MDIIDKLSEWGCDTEHALGRMLGDRELYIGLIMKYNNTFNVDRLGELITQGRAKEAFEAAHDLKGAFGNLGLEPLYVLICKLVEPLREGKCDGLEATVAELKAKKAEFDKLIAN